MRDEYISKIGHLIRTQDNRATADPIFIVQQKRRIWGMDPDYHEDYKWIAEDDPEVEADAELAADLDDSDWIGEPISGWEKRYYVDIWDFVTACFTEQGCQDFIDANRHNLNEPRIYAASAHRNQEFIVVREMLKKL